MIQIFNDVKGEQENFWNHCHFHPTDAIEDSWGKRLLDRFSSDGAIRTVRMYAMLEDIVTMDEEGSLCYDFRLNDLRLDYLVERGYQVLICYCFFPECITQVRYPDAEPFEGKKRYKDKRVNTLLPKDYGLWEEICYAYTRHIVERYGMDIVSNWRCQCYNEPDGRGFFMSEVPGGCNEERINEYCKVYASFAKGVKRACTEVKIGGPAVGWNKFEFLDAFLKYVKERKVEIDFVSLHNYGTAPIYMSNGTRPLNVKNNIENHKNQLEIITRHGFSHLEIIVDEWGASSIGYANKTREPALIFRETEVFAAYYVRMIYEFIEQELPVDRMLICLSGQHGMTDYFSGYRNFFTMNYIAKPIYAAFVLASKLGRKLLRAQCDNPNIYTIATQTLDDGYAVLMSYCNDCLTEELPQTMEWVEFTQDLTGKRFQIYCIDKKNTNSYRLYERKGIETPSEEEIKELREAGKLKPILDFQMTDGEPLSLTFTANSTYLILVS